MVYKGVIMDYVYREQIIEELTEELADQDDRMLEILARIVLNRDVKIE